VELHGTFKISKKKIRRTNIIDMREFVVAVVE
jgi:hypothetical protein